MLVRLLTPTTSGSSPIMDSKWGYPVPTSLAEWLPINLVLILLTFFQKSTYMIHWESNRLSLLHCFSSSETTWRSPCYWNGVNWSLIIVFTPLFTAHPHSYSHFYPNFTVYSEWLPTKDSCTKSPCYWRPQLLSGTFPPSSKHPISADSSLFLIYTDRVLIQPQLSHQSSQLPLAQQLE